MILIKKNISLGCLCLLDFRIARGPNKDKIDTSILEALDGCVGILGISQIFVISQLSVNKRHAMHAEAMTFHKGSLIIFRTFVKKLR